MKIKDENILLEHVIQFDFVSNIFGSENSTNYKLQNASADKIYSKPHSLCSKAQNLFKTNLVVERELQPFPIQCLIQKSYSKENKS